MIMTVMIRMIDILLLLTMIMMMMMVIWARPV